MTITENVESQLKAATLNRDEPLKMTLRNIKAKFLEAVKNNKNLPISEEVEISVLKKMVKDREKSIELCGGQSERGNEIAENEKREILIINTFLPETPEQLSESVISEAVGNIVQAFGYSTMKDMGKIMAEFNIQHPGQDKKLVSEKIKSLLTM